MARANRLAVPFGRHTNAHTVHGGYALEGLRAIHLVCTAGVVQNIRDLRTGLKTMQEACTAAAVCTPVSEWSG